MSYIGRGIDQIDNISTLDNLSFNGSDATFNLTQNGVAFTPVSSSALNIQIDGVIQSNNYSVNNATVTFDFVPSASSVCNNIRHYGVGLLTTVSDSSITTAKLGADSVNGSKIADDSISDEHLDITAITGQTAITSLADTDKFLVSDASDSGNLKYVEKQYLPSGTLVKIANGNTTGASVSYVDVAGCFTSTYKIYKIFFYDVNTASDTALYMRWLTGSSTEQSGNDYTWGISGFNSSNGGSNSGGQATYINLIGEDMRHDADEQFAMEGTLYNPSGTTLKKRFNYHSGGRRTGNYTTVGVGSAEWNSTTAITGFRFLTNTGNLDSMYYVVYGVVI